MSPIMVRKTASFFSASLITLATKSFHVLLPVIYFKLEGSYLMSDNLFNSMHLVDLILVTSYIKLTTENNATQLKVFTGSDTGIKRIKITTVVLSKIYHTVLK